MRVAIIGAGLGGLCVAQGLRQAGIEVAVYERDWSAAARAQGYRLSIDARGDEALRACLPERLFKLYEATCGQPSLGGALVVTDGEVLTQAGSMQFSQDASGRPAHGVAAPGRAVDRLILRETLLAGLVDSLRFGKEFRRYEEHGTEVEVHFADGTAVTADLLVAADGVGSRVRQQLLPEVSLVDTGTRWLGGRTLLDERLRAQLPDSVEDRAVWVRDSGKLWFLAPVFFEQPPNDAARGLWPGRQCTDY